MAKKVPQIIEEQVQFWMRKKSAEKKFSFPEKKMPVITISREFGAKGAALAELLGDQLGFKVWDKDLLTVISDEIGASKEFIKSLDEARRSMVEDTIFGFMNQKGTNLNYLIFLVKTVRMIEKYGNSIIVGRGANYICRSSRALHVRIVAPLRKRVADYAKAKGISKMKASGIVLQKDEERKSFTQYNFSRDLGNPSDYDLLINSDTYSLEEMAKIVLQAYELKTKIKMNGVRKVV